MTLSPIIAILIGVVILIAILIYFIPIQLYLNAKSAGLNIELTHLLFMKIRKADPYEIINSAILLKKNGINVNIDQLEMHYLGTGSPKLISQALVLAKENNIDVSFNTISAIDLAGRNPVNCVKECIKEHILNANPETFISKEGKEYKVSFTIKAKPNINKIIGGGDDGQVLINCIFDYIEKIITNSDNSNDINPEKLSKDILKEFFSNKSVFDIKEIKININ